MFPEIHAFLILIELSILPKSTQLQLCCFMLYLSAGNDKYPSFVIVVVVAMWRKLDVCFLGWASGWALVNVLFVLLWSGREISSPTTHRGAERKDGAEIP